VVVTTATPYCGFKRQADKRNGVQIYVPRSAAHVLVSGPTETGKTRRILAPAAVLWGGPAVVVSPKDDLLQYVLERRWGPMALIDMRPISMPVYPEGLGTFRHDPTVTTCTPHEALAVAETIMQAATLARGWGANHVRDRGIWELRAIGPLGALLYAASPAGNSQGMEWVLRAVDNMNPDCTNEPGWHQAVSICQGAEVLALGLRRTLEMEDPHLRDSVAMAMRAALTPWLRTTSLVQQPATEVAERFDPRFLDDPQATLFVLAPGDGTVTTSVVALLDSLIRRWRDKTAAREPLERLLMIVDDLPNTAPIPKLPSIVGEGSALGVNLLASVQASSQLATVYGIAHAEELRDIFPATLIMYGAREPELMGAAERWSGLTTRRPESFDQDSGNTTLYTELGAGLRWQELLPRNRDEARLLVRGLLGSSVATPDWTVFREHYDAAVRNILSRGDGPNSGSDPSVLERLRRWWRVDEIDLGAAAAK
jgi:type IV secretory system conjugative DNA transfer VirD4/TraG family protein